MENYFVRPGVIEGFVGPMKSKETEGLLSRLDKVRWVPGAKFIAFKPDIDDRGIGSRIVKDFVEWIYIPHDKPEEILKYVKPEHDVIGITEVQFFIESLLGIVLKLQRDGKNIIFEGLDLDFKKEPFETTAKLMIYANELERRYAVCEVCGRPAYYTQRLVDGKPAKKDDDVVVTEKEGSRITYVPRCFKHHYI